MQVLIKKGVATIKMLQRQHETLEQAAEIAETIAGLTHDAAPAAKKVLEGLSELATILPRTKASDTEGDAAQVAGKTPAAAADKSKGSKPAA